MKVQPCLFYTPVTRLDALAKGLPPGVEALVLDLEDSVPPAAKPGARARLAEADLSATGLDGVAVRINTIETPDGLADLTTLLELGGRIGGLPVRTVLVPKVAGARDVLIHRSLLSTLPEPPEICTFIETVDAVEQAFEIAAVSDGLCFGQADLVAEMWAPDASYLAHARARLCVAAARYGLPAIDTNTFELWDAELIREQSDAARACGFTGKAAIHPRQVEPITAAFTVTEAELDEYRQTIKDYESDARGFTVSRDRVVAPPFVLRARRMLQLHDGRAVPTR